MFDPIPLLTRIARAPDHAARVEALISMLAWFRAGSEPATTNNRTGAVIQVLTRDVELRKAIQLALSRCIAHMDATNLFGCTGLPNERGFWAESGERLLAKVLPVPKDHHDLAKLIRSAYPDADAVAHLVQVSADDFMRLCELVVEPSHADQWNQLTKGFVDGFRLLAIRIQAHGLSSTLRRRSAVSPVDKSPFFRLASQSLAMADAWQQAQPAADQLHVWHDTVAACRGALTQIHECMQDQGVSVDSVYAVDVIKRCLGRMESMVAIMDANSVSARYEAIRNMWVEIVTVAFQERSVRHLARTNLRLLHQKIVERSGQTGEHYVATNRGDYQQIWFDAAGGGLLTTVTAVIKTGVSVFAHAVHLAPFATGFLYGINYAASFVALQHCHLILATKQPAMTAATLAGVMRDRQNESERLDEMVEHTVRIVHSQIAAAIGNVVMVALGAAAFDIVWRVMTGRHWLAHADALAIYQDLSPVNSLTVLYAAETGVILWLSSLIGGWFDNWSAYHRIPQGIADARPSHFLSVDRLAHWSVAWKTHCAGWATNISLGFMLGFAPLIGAFFYLPIDVRHVTLSTGVLALAASGLEADWFRGGVFLYAVIGIMSMFALNLGVSFSLSLLTAMRSFQLPAGEIRELMRRLAWRLFRHPLDFIRPPPR